MLHALRCRNRNNAGLFAGIHFNRAILFEGIGSDSNFPTILTGIIALGTDGSGGSIGDIVCREYDLAIFLRHAIGLYQTRIGQAIHHFTSSRCREKGDFTAIGFDRAGVANQLRLHFIRYRHFHQAIAIKINRGRITGCQSHFTQTSNNHPIIDHARSNQTHQPCILRSNGTVINNLRIRVASLVKYQFAVTIHKLIVADVGRGGDDTVHIDFGIIAKQYAVLVDDNDIAIGSELAINRTCAVAINPVQGQRRSCRLMERSRLIGRDIKPAPVNHCFVTLLIYIDFLGRTSNCSLTRTHHATHRISKHSRRQRAPKQRKNPANPPIFTYSQHNTPFEYRVILTHLRPNSKHNQYLTRYFLRVLWAFRQIYLKF